MTPQEIQAGLEAIIYAADEPATLDQIAKALGIEKPEARAALDQLTADLPDRRPRHRSPQSSRRLEVLHQSSAPRRSPQIHQKPATTAAPNHARAGNASSDRLQAAGHSPGDQRNSRRPRRRRNKTLLEKRLITTAGRKEVIGRPILYRTSKQFMMRFGLSDLDELPSLKEFEALAQAALGSDEGIAELQPEDQPEDQAEGQPANQETTADATDAAPSTEVAATTSSTATESQASGEDAKDSISRRLRRARSRISILRNARSNGRRNFRRIGKTPAIETTQDSAEESDKSRAAAASSSPHRTNEPSA